MLFANPVPITEPPVLCARNWASSGVVPSAIHPSSQSARPPSTDMSTTRGGPEGAGVAVSDGIGLAVGAIVELTVLVGCSMTIGLAGECVGDGIEGESAGGCPRHPAASTPREHVMLKRHKRLRTAIPP